MAANIRLKLKTGPLDNWSVKEKLALASSVKRSGDQNWVSVSRAIRPYGEINRPADCFSQKNCALQYADLLEKAETPKRKRGDKGEVIETPANQIVRKLTIERIEELKRLVQEEQQRYKAMKMEVHCLKAGQWDNRLAEVWAQMRTDKKAAEEKAAEEERKANEENTIRAQLQATRRAPHVQRANSSVSSISEVDDSTQDSIIEQLNVETTDDENSMPPSTIGPVRPINIEIPPMTSINEPNKPIPPTSPLLSSLLQSKQFSVDGLQQIKAVAEAKEALIQAANQQAAMQESANQKQPEQTSSQQLQDEVVPEPGTPTLTKLLGTTAVTQVKVEGEPVTVLAQITETVKTEAVATVVEQVDVEVTPPPDPEGETVEIEAVEAEAVPAVPEVKQEPVAMSEEESDATDTGTTNTSFIPVDEEVSIKEEPPSPASSVSSRVSETGSKTCGRKRKGRSSAGTRRISGRVTRRSAADDDRKEETRSRVGSDGDSSEDDGDDHSSTANPGQSGMSVLSDSIPNSPLSHSSDTEDDKAYKTWKKSIMLVWRAAANHKYANVFLHPVTDDIAPGYKSVVRRPKDLSTIKRHIENGMIRTTSEFQRDMMLMFTNAVMYNSSNHNVYKMAVEMYDDVMVHIEQYVNAQLMVQSTDTKLLRPTRRNESSDKEEESRRRRTSSEAMSEGGKTKKRKGRGDDT